jgi:AcrR family transcriptional regulator
MAAAGNGVPMKRRSAEQTRQLLLDTAVQILHEKGPAAGVLHVRLSDVLTRTGLTTGAAYRLWDNQQDFHDALAVAAMRWRDRSMLERTTQAAFSVVAGGGGLEDLLRAAGAANVQDLPADNGIMTTLALRAAAYNQPGLLRASAERSQHMVASFHQLYLDLLRTYGLRMQEPFTLDHLADGMSALVDGFGVQTACGAQHPSITLGDNSWTLLGVCLTALVRHMTEPDPAAPVQSPADSAENSAGVSPADSAAPA